MSATWGGNRVSGRTYRPVIFSERLPQRIIHCGHGFSFLYDQWELIAVMKLAAHLDLLGEQLCLHFPLSPGIALLRLECFTLLVHRLIYDVHTIFHNFRSALPVL